NAIYQVGAGPVVPTAMQSPPVTVPSAGLRVRLVASDLAATLSDGSEVAAWPNRGSDGDAVQTSSSKRPTFHAGGGGFNGQAHVGFNESTDNDEVLEITGVAEHGSATLIAVYRQDDANRHNYGIFAPYGSSSNRAAFVTYRSKGAHRLSYWDATNGWRDSGTTLGAGQDRVVMWRVQGSGQVDFTVDGAPSGTASLPSDIHTPFDRYVIGATQPNTKARFDGQIAELIFYDRALPDCEADQIVEDLGARYGVSVSVTPAPCDPPAAPSGLSATAVGGQQVDLSWTDGSNNEDGFRVERREGQTGAWQTVMDLPANTTSYTDGSVAAGTEYCYRVSAFNGSGPSTSSNVDCATTDPPDPLPSPITVPTTGLRVRLVANELAGTVPDGGNVAVWANLGSDTDAQQGNAGRQPTFHAGMGAAFNGQAHVGFNESTDNDEVLEIPGVSGHGSGTLIAVLSQEASESHNHGLFAPWGSASTRSSFLTHRGSDGLISYWDTDDGWLSSTASVVVDAEHVVVWRVDGSTGVDFSVDGTPAGSVAKAGDIPTGIDRYVVGATEPDTPSRFDGQIAELLFYDRWLPGCEADQIVEDLGARYGVSVSVTPAPCDPPAAPSGLSATAFDYRQVDLSWTVGSNNEDGFRVERRLGQTGIWQRIATLPPNTTAYSDMPLIPETEYCYRISAFNQDGSSGYSAVACETTPTAPPGACFDTGNHDDLGPLWNIVQIGSDLSETWSASQLPGCEMVAWYFGLDTGVDSDHPDLNILEATSFVAAEPGHSGEDGHGHGTHTAGTAAAIDGNGGVVGVAPGAPIYSFRVCADNGECSLDDIVAGVDEVTARKQANSVQPMVANMSLGGSVSAVMDEAVRRSVNAGVVYALAAGNGILGACLFANDAANVSPARSGDDDINASNGSDGNTLRVNGVMTVTSSTSSDGDAGCNYGNPVTIAAPGVGIFSTWTNGGYSTISGTSMATPHAAGAAILYLQSFPDATPTQIEAAIVNALAPWNTSHQSNALGRLNIPNF
ncbi:MAG: S8 family serine peptidase, partial [Gemmatimonadota bacterium]|nr:S8 family serine peptidase [Gemmatimonadota bacterium]